MSGEVGRNTGEFNRHCKFLSTYLTIVLLRIND